MAYSYKVTLKKNNDKKTFNFSYVKMSDLFYELALKDGKMQFKENPFIFDLIINELNLIESFSTFGFNFIFKDIENNYIVIECISYKKFDDLKRALRLFNVDYYKKLENNNDFLKYVLSLDLYENLKESERFTYFLTKNFDLSNFKEVLNYMKLQRND